MDLDLYSSNHNNIDNVQTKLQNVQTVLKYAYSRQRELQREIDSLKAEEREIERQIKNSVANEALIHLENRLKHSKVLFDNLPFEVMPLHHSLIAYNILSYKYTLHINGIDANLKYKKYKYFENNIDMTNVMITEIPMPKNNTEAYLYPYIQQYISLPVRLMLVSIDENEEYDTGYMLKSPVENIMFDDKEPNKAYIYVLL